MVSGSSRFQELLSCHPGTGMEGGLGDRGEELLKHQLWRWGGRQSPHWNSWKHHGYNQRRLWFINLKQAILAHGIKFKKENAVKCKFPLPPLAFQLCGSPPEATVFDSVWLGMDNFSGY